MDLIELLVKYEAEPNAIDSEIVFSRKSRSNNRVAPVALIRRETRYMSVLILRP